MKNMDGINYVARRCWIVGMKNDGIEFCVKSGMCWFIENGYWVLDEKTYSGEYNRKIYIRHDYYRFRIKPFIKGIIGY